MKSKIADWLKETAIGLVLSLAVMAALFGGTFLRGWTGETDDLAGAAPAAVGIKSAVDRGTSGGSAAVDRGMAGRLIGQAEPVELEAVAADIVQSAEDVPSPVIEVPEYIIRITEEVGQAYCISPELLQAIAWRESRFDPDAVNASGTCFGLMQVSTKWHGHRLGPGEDIMDPAVNIRAAAEYLVELFERYKDPALVLMIYNGDSRWKDYAAGRCSASGYAVEIMDMAEELEADNEQD